MQSISGFKKWNALCFKTSLKCLHRSIFCVYNRNEYWRSQNPFKNEILEQPICSLFNHLQREYDSAYFALKREITRNNLLNGRRCFSTSSTNDCAQNNKGRDSSGSNKGPNKDDKDKTNALLLRFAILSTIFYFSVTYAVYQYVNNDRPNTESPLFVSWNEFVHQMLLKGEVKELIVRPEIDMVTIILHDGAVIKGKRSRFKSYHIIVPNTTQFEQKVRDIEKQLGIKPENGVSISYVRRGEFFQLAFFLLLAIIAIILIKSKLSANVKFPGDLFSQMTRAKFTLIEPFVGKGKGVKFSDVAGLKEAKIEIMEFVDYLKTPEHYKKLGAKVPKGALLLGPPGCGKTLLAKAVATEANVPFLSMNGSEFIEMIGGLGAARVRDLFKEGKKRAPSIIYIDEIDAIGKKRSERGTEGSNSEGEQTLNQLLTEMDGMVSNQEVMVLASTNRAEVLDKALLRPGRFDRHILIDLPTLEERKQIFEQHLKGIQLQYKPSNYSSRLAYLTPGFSGADIANVCNEAALHAAREKKKVVDANDLLYAVDRTIAGIEKRDNTIAPSEKKTVAYHEAGHALVGWLLEHTDALLKVTIVPRTNRALGFSQFTTSDQKLYTKEQLFERMCMSLGGRVAESLTFNKVTTGAQNDLEKVTKLAYAQIQQYGMDEIVGLLSFHPEQTDTKTRKPYSKMLSKLMDEEARNLIAKAYKRTEQLLKENKEKLELLAEELLKRETLTYEEVEKLIGPPPYGKKNLIDIADFESDVPDSPVSPESQSQSNPT